MEQMMRQLINDVFYDLEHAIEGTDEVLDAEILADVLASPARRWAQWLDTPWKDRRALALQIASDYV